MTSVLLTAFAPFAHWEDNSSWLALQALTKNRPDHLHLVTRRYPVEYALARQQLERDLADHPFDFAIHLGQSARASKIEIESIALNVAEYFADGRTYHKTLCPDGPIAYQTQLPVVEFDQLLSEQSIPCRVSYHAGTFLCNAIYYWSHYLAAQSGSAMLSLFLHLPLAPEQSSEVNTEFVGSPLDPEVTARAVRSILLRLASHQPRHG